jgi:hypothetical protein
MLCVMLEEWQGSDDGDLPEDQRGMFENSATDFVPASVSAVEAASQLP